MSVFSSAGPPPDDDPPPCALPPTNRPLTARPTRRASCPSTAPRWRSRPTRSAAASRCTSRASAARARASLTARSASSRSRCRCVLRMCCVLCSAYCLRRPSPWWAQNPPALDTHKQHPPPHTHTQTTPLHTQQQTTGPLQARDRRRRDLPRPGVRQARLRAALHRRDRAHRRVQGLQQQRARRRAHGAAVLYEPRARGVPGAPRARVRVL